MDLEKSDWIAFAAIVIAVVNFIYTIYKSSRQETRIAEMEAQALGSAAIEYTYTPPAAREPTGLHFVNPGPGTARNVKLEINGGEEYDVATVTWQVPSVLTPQARAFFKYRGFMGRPRPVRFKLTWIDGNGDDQVLESPIG